MRFDAVISDCLRSFSLQAVQGKGSRYISLINKKRCMMPVIFSLEVELSTHYFYSLFLFVQKIPDVLAVFFALTRCEIWCKKLIIVLILYSIVKSHAFGWAVQDGRACRSCLRIVKNLFNLH